MTDRREVATYRQQMSRIRDTILARMRTDDSDNFSRLKTDRYTASVHEKSRRVIPSSLQSQLTTMRKCRLVHVKDRETGKVVLKWRCNGGARKKKTT